MPANQPVLTLTEAATEQIKNLLAKRAEKPAGVRIKVKQGGCSGQKYFVEYANSVEKFDEVIDVSGVRVLIDPKALMYLIGSEMDYINEKFKSGFVFSNPNEKSRCGCGQSFSV